MTDLERRLREALEDEARTAPPPREGAGAVRRTRRRQVLTAAGGALAVVAIAVGATIGIRAAVDADGRLPAGPSTTTTTINGIAITHPDGWYVFDPGVEGLNGPTDAPGNQRPGLPRLVLGVYPTDLGELFACPGMVGGPPATFAMTVEERPLALAGDAAAPWPVAPRRLAEGLTNSACYPDWELWEAEWTAVDRSFRARIGFAPDIAETDRRALLGAFASMTFDPTGEPVASVVLATGTAGGEEWELRAERQDDQLVLSLDGETFGMGGGFDPSPGELVTLQHGFGSGYERTLVVFGAVPSEAVRVNVLTDPDAEGVFDVLDVPDEIGGDLNAFVVTVGAGGEPMPITAYDDADRIVASGMIFPDAAGEGEPVGTQPPTLPPEVQPLHGGTSWGLYLAVAPSAGDPEIERWTERMETIGYTPSSGDLACDDGAAEALGVDPGWSRVAVYFATRQDAETAAGTIEISLELGTPVGVARVTTYCLD